MKVNIKLKSKDGCTFHIVGNVSLTWTGGFDNFSGTVSISGEGCNGGTYTFGLVRDGDENPKENLGVILSPNSISQVSNVAWKSTKKEFDKIAEALNASEINDAIVKEFRTIAQNINPCKPDNITVTVNVNVNK